MNRGIVAYQAKKLDTGIYLTKYYNKKQDCLLATNWQEAENFLVEDKGKAIHITWNLPQFAQILFSLLPKEVAKELAENPRAYYGFSKIFYTERLLGITQTKNISGNFFQTRENNFYSINRWVSLLEPESLAEIAQIGEQILTALEKLGIYTDKLTSPIGVYEEELRKYSLPTIWSNDNVTFLNACNYCLPMMHYEWRQVFNKTIKEPQFTYDIISAYPHFISRLPNTDNAIVWYSTSRTAIKDHDWGIMKGIVTIDKDSKINPIPCDLNSNISDEYTFPESGTWNTYITTREKEWLGMTGIGKFEMESGFFFKFTTSDKPYFKLVSNLMEARKANGSDKILSGITKRVAQGISGKLDQINRDGGLGELYNPIYAAMVRSRCRLAVGDFVIKNHLSDSITEVNVDSVTTPNKLDIAGTKPGEWRRKEGLFGKQ